VVPPKLPFPIGSCFCRPRGAVWASKVARKGHSVCPVISTTDPLPQEIPSWFLKPLIGVDLTLPFSFLSSGFSPSIRTSADPALIVIAHVQSLMEEFDRFVVPLVASSRFCSCGLLLLRGSHPRRTTFSCLFSLPPLLLRLSGFVVLILPLFL